jgi:hypothetical protein
MGKHSHKEGRTSEKEFNGIGSPKSAIKVPKEAVDPTLALLFASSVSTANLIFLKLRIDRIHRLVQLKFLQNPVMRNHPRLPRENMSLKSLKRNPRPTRWKWTARKTI